MIQNISQSERLDILLILALAFERHPGKPAEQTSVKLVNESFAALSGEDLETLQLRAQLFDSLPVKEQKIWQASWLDKIRRRGKPTRLDEQINPSQITEVLRSETKAVQELILRHLPINISGQVASELGIKSGSSILSKARHQPINDKIVALVRQKFLSHFVALEDIYEPTEADKLSIRELAKFIRQLGVRETAIACRGISSKESLAVFLGRFNKSDAREIAKYITELEKIKPFWVAEADKLVRQTLERDFQPDDLLQSLGLQLLASGFVSREAMAQKYTAQKMSPSESEKWLAYLQKSTEDFSSASTDERLRLEKRQRIFERLIIRFGQPKHI